MHNPGGFPWVEEKAEFLLKQIIGQCVEGDSMNWPPVSRDMTLPSDWVNLTISLSLYFMNARHLVMPRPRFNRISQTMASVSPSYLSPGRSSHGILTAIAGGLYRNR